MDHKGRIYVEPTDEQVENKKLVELNKDDMTRIRKLNELERKMLYKEKILLTSEKRTKPKWPMTLGEIATMRAMAGKMRKHFSRLMKEKYS